MIHSAPLRSRHPAWLLLVLLVVLPSCTTTRDYAGIDRALAAGRPAEALTVLEGHKSSYGSRSEVLYLMDKGMLQHLAGEYQESNRSLAKAEELTEALYTRRITSEVEAFLTTDNALPYEGEEFEKVMLNVIMAMNYVQLGLAEDALVEARKVDHKLSVLKDRNRGKITYSTDPFARYLSGILYEAMGDPSNALVSYRLAFEAFRQAQTLYGTPLPDLLGRDLLRLTEVLGLTDEHGEYRKRFPAVTWQSAAQTKDLAELIFVTYVGRAPLKYDVFIDVPFSLDALGVVLATRGLMRPRYGDPRYGDPRYGDPRYGSPRYGDPRYGSPRYGDPRGVESVLYGLTGHIMRLAVPRFAPRRSTVGHTEAVVVGHETEQRVQLALMEDITSIAIKDLDERIVRTTVKAVARAAWKYALAEGVELGTREAFGRNRDGAHLAGAIAGALARALAIASEEADKRSWATLPDRIQLGRVLVPPGTYDVQFHYSGRHGEVFARQTVSQVTVAAGQKQFITTRFVQ